MRAGEHDSAAAQAILSAIDSLPALYQQLPLEQMPVLRRDAPYYFDWLAHPGYDNYWRAIAPLDVSAPATPALHIGGWFDIFIQGTLANYQEDRRRGTGASGAPGSRLIVGPWSHGYYGGNVSAPIFKRIAEATLRYLGVGPSLNPAPPVLVARDGSSA